MAMIFDVLIYYLADYLISTSLHVYRLIYMKGHKQQWFILQMGTFICKLLAKIYPNADMFCSSLYMQ